MQNAGDGKRRGWLRELLTPGFGVWFGAAFGFASIFFISERMPPLAVSLLIVLVIACGTIFTYVRLSPLEKTQINLFVGAIAKLVARNWPAPFAVLGWVLAMYISWQLLDPRSDDTNTLMVEWLKVAGPAGAAFFLAAGLVYTHRSSENARKALELQRQTSERQEERLREDREDARRSEQNERFFKAVQLLGERGNEGAHIGALFALEQLANESDYHYHQVIDGICAFVRSRSAEYMPDSKREFDDWRDAPSAPHDIRVAMSVLARRRKSLGDGEQRGLDLSDSYLVGIDLSGGDFQLANFNSAVFANSHFRDTNFARAKFVESILQFSSFFNCIFCISDFMGAKMQHATIAFIGTVADPSLRVAIESISGVEPNVQRAFESEFDFASNELVNAGRFLDDSQWINTEVEALTIEDFGFLEEDREPLDLSKMALINRHQWSVIKKPDNVIPPFHLELRP